MRRARRAGATASTCTATTSARKRDREPEGADLAIKAAEHTPSVVQHAISRVLCQPTHVQPGGLQHSRARREPMYLLGCPLQATYPVVPLADRHAVWDRHDERSASGACFGVYADREALPDAAALAGDIDDALTELLVLSPTG